LPARKDGKQGHKFDKLWRDALMVAVKREAANLEGKPTRKLTLLAEKTVEMGLEGDMTAIKEIGDRLDGKPVQGISSTDPEGKPANFIMMIQADD